MRKENGRVTRVKAIQGEERSRRVGKEARYHGCFISLR